MKKWLKWLIVPACVIGIGLLAITQAADNTKRPGYYDDLSFTASDMVGFVIDSSTTTGYQLKRRIMTIPLSSGAVVDTVTDSLWTQLMQVPVGRSVVLKAASISARVEADMNGAAKTIKLWVVWYDLSGATLDTIVAPIHIDKDSCVYNNAALALTRLDSSFAAGDILWAMIYNDSTVTTSPEGLGITLDYLLDE